MADLSDAFGDEGFDATNIEPQQSFEPLPVGKYVVMVTASDVRQTKNGSGKYVWLEMTVMEGEYEGRKVFTQINFQNASQQAQDIGQKQLSGLCHAVGKLRVKDTSEYHDTPFIVDLKIKDDPQYGLQNRVTSFHPVNVESAPAVANPAPTPGKAPAKSAPQSTAKAASGKPAWLKK